jgi:hypothetical protein
LVSLNTSRINRSISKHSTTFIVIFADTVPDRFLTVTVAVPMANAVTRPKDETDNTVGSLLINSIGSLASAGDFLIESV